MSRVSTRDLPPSRTCTARDSARVLHARDGKRSAADKHDVQDPACDRGTESAAFALWHVSGCAAGERALRVHVRALACCALSEHAQANNVAALLSRLK